MHNANIQNDVRNGKDTKLDFRACLSLQAGVTLATDVSQRRRIATTFRSWYLMNKNEAGFSPTKSSKSGVCSRGASAKKMPDKFAFGERTKQC